MVLLLHASNDVKDGVYVVRSCGHGETACATGGAVDEKIVRRQSHVHSREHKRDRWEHDGAGVTSVETSE